MIDLSMIAIGFIAGFFTMTIIGLYKWVLQLNDSDI